MDLQVARFCINHRVYAAVQNAFVEGQYSDTRKEAYRHRKYDDEATHFVAPDISPGYSEDHGYGFIFSWIEQGLNGSV